MTHPRRRDVLRLSALFAALSPLSGCGGADAGQVAAPPAPLPGTSPSPPPAPSPSPPPGPPPVAGTGARQFSLLSAATQTAPFCVGFALRKGDIPSGSGVVIGGADAQATIKSRWPDGSARFAVIAGTASVTAGVPAAVTLAAGTAPSGTEMTTADLQRLMTQPVTIDCGSIGAASWSGADWSSPFETWIVGHRMSSWVYRKPVGSDAHLVAWLEVRLWDTGAVEVLPWVENGYLLVSGPTSKSSTYTFTMGGAPRYSGAIDLPHHCRTPLIDGSVLSYWLGPDPNVAIAHDTDYLQTTGLVPAYYGKTSSGAASITSLPTSYTPLQYGSWPAAMGSGGYDKSIGLLPEWDVVYLTAPGATTYKGVVFNGYSAGGFPFHYREDPTFATVGDRYRPVRLSNHPLLNIKPPEVGWETTPATSGTAPHTWSLSHQPSAGFLAYLVTGRRYFLDEIQFAANTNALFISSTTREGGLGLFKSQAAGNERHVAWCLRTLAQAIAATPESDTKMLSELRVQYQNNLNYYHARYVGADPASPRINNGGFVEPSIDTNSGFALVNGRVTAGATATIIPMNAGGFKQSSAADDQFVGWSLTIGGESRRVTAYVKSTNTFTVSPAFSSAPTDGATAWADDGVCWVTIWMQDFVTASWGYAKDLGLGLSTTAATQLDELFAWKAQGVVGRFGSTGAGEYLYRDYGPYYLAIAPTDTPDWANGTGPWYFPNWGSVYNATWAGKTSPDSSLPPYLVPGPRVEGGIRLWYVQNSGPIAALPALAYAVKHGIAGAEAGYRRLTSADDWPAMRVDLDAQPVWGVAPAVGAR